MQEHAKDLAMENELLNLQVSQLQEELEHYFTQYNELKESQVITGSQIAKRDADKPRFSATLLNLINTKQVEVEPENEHRELEYLRQQLAGALADLQQQKIVNEVVTGDVSELKKERDTYKAQLAIALEENTSSQASTSEQFSLFELQIEQLQEKLEQSFEEGQSLRQKHEEVSLDNERLTKELKNAVPSRQQLQVLQDENIELSYELSRSAQNKNQELEKDLATKLEMLNATESQLHKEREMSERLQEQWQSIHQQQQQLVTEKTEGLAKLQAALQHSKEAELELSTSLESSKQQLEQALQKCTEANSKVEHLELSYQDALAQLEALKHALSSKEQEFEQEVALLRKEKDVLNESLRDEFTQQVDALSAEKDELEKKLTDEFNWHQEFKGQAHTLQQENDKLKIDLDDKTNALSALTASKDEIEQQKRELDFRQQSLDSEIAKVESQLEMIKDLVLKEKAF